MPNLNTVPLEIASDADAACHLDHAMTAYQRRYAIAMVREGKAALLVGEFGPGFYICSVTLPADLGTVPCALRGPIMGDQPISEDSATYVIRGYRKYASRMTQLPAIKADTITVISVGGKLDTMFGGPLSPQETGDPGCPIERLQASRDFWADHALSVTG